MIVLGLIFFALLFIIFGIVVFMTRPTTEQNTIHRRMAALTLPQLRPGIMGSNGRYALTITEPKAFRWLDTLIRGSKFAREIDLLLTQSNKDSSVGAIAIAMISLSLVTFLIVYMLSSTILVSLVAATIACYLPIAGLRLRRYRRITAFNAVLPDCIETCARSLRAGHSIIAAINIVTELAVEPAKTEFGEVFKKQNYGLPLRDAFTQMLERVPSPDLQVMVTGILVQKDTGGNLAEILDRTAEVIRDRLRIQREIRTHTAQGRLTGWILFLLPLILMGAINLVNPGYSNILFSDPLGKKILYIGLMLLIIGGLVIRQIVKGIEL